MSIALKDEELIWPCFECSEKFRTSAQMQRHLIQHDRGSARNSEDVDADDQTTGDADNSFEAPSGPVKRKRGRPRKQFREIDIKSEILTEVRRDLDLLNLRCGS